MQSIIKALLLLSMVVGLALPSATMGSSYEEPCPSPAECTEAPEVLPCHDCPPCPDEHDESLPCDKDNDCPSHQHHHHHQVSPPAVAAWLIPDGGAFSFHPPMNKGLRSDIGFLFYPEAPASVLDRPPIS